MDLQTVLHELFLKAPVNCFDAVIVECGKWYEKPAHTFVELRTRENKKLRGDIFEVFCVLYLKSVKGYDEVWRLEDVPEELLAQLSLKRKDMGIDLIAQRGTTFSAVQCKYKKPTGKKSIVTWKALSTFYSLCMRSGPWEKYIVMTNCDYIRHVGAKTDKDLSICLRSFQGITKEQWVGLCGMEGRKMADAPETDALPVTEAQAQAPPEELPPVNTIEELRAARIRYYTKAV
jgi:hypothetical protein